jgi:eukaryotic-like serine/threonine-protein kinase
MDTSAPDPQANLPSTIGPYRIERKIGSGGMGTVYLATHDETGQVAAVKVLPASMSREEGFVARFQREVDALRKLHNPNVVELYDDGLDHETYYYAMEYVDGVTLNEEIREKGRINWRQAIGIAVQVCYALKAAHDAGVIHRDLKPSNLILGKDGLVKLTDFGVAQVFAGTRLTRTGGVIGTVEYMSPEQAKGGRVTKKSDLYSLGAVLYAMLTGRPPFLGKTSLEVVQKHQFGRFDKPILFAPDMPHWLDELVCQLLEKDPDKRPPDAYVLSRRLQEIVKKVDLSLMDETVAIEDRRQNRAMDATVAAETRISLAGGPGIGTVMRDAVRRELLAGAEHGFFGRLFNNIYFLVAALVLLILGGVWWYRSRTLTPEQHFEAGVALMSEDAGDSWIKARDEHFQPLLDDHPRQWKQKVEPYLQRIRLYELERRVTTGRRLGRLKRPQSEPERFLLAAVQMRELGQLDRAEQWLTALASLTDGDAEHADVNRLAEKLLADVRAERNRQRRQSTLLKDAFAKADAHLKRNELKQARTVWRSIITLYGNNPAAKADVARARELLNGKPETRNPKSEGNDQ